jgi:hypothetical protein
MKESYVKGLANRNGPSHALDALYAGLLTRKVNWLLDGDISSFFDGLDHCWVVKFIEHRIARGATHSQMAERRRAGPGTVVVQ